MQARSLLSRASSAALRKAARSTAAAPSLSGARSFSKTSSASAEHPPAIANIGTNVFDYKLLGDKLRKALKDSQRTGKPLSDDHKDAIASAIGDWALSRGCVNFAHWFSPMRGSNAEKHDGLIDLNFATGDIKGGVLSGARLFLGETDGSSFPNGGLRATHRAAAYTAWDTSSPPFIREDTLYVPAAFVGWNGEPLDDKTPLLRSQEAVNQQGVRLLRLLGDKKANEVIANVGWEQEFFVIDADAHDRRPDLVHTGRTLVGALSYRNQQLEQNYFARTNPRVRAFLRDVQAELWALGISLNCIHNEVAPSQHEFSPIFTVTNRAADTNFLALDVLQDIAARHGLAALIHEKPFKGINGSGKHNNWGLNTDTGANLFTAGKTPEDQERFIAFTSALMYAISQHGDLLRVGTATPGNDHRLGAQEAPPAIVSLYTGEILEKHLRAVADGGPLAGYGRESQTLEFGSRSVQPVKAAKEDRNRTAPFPFCGNRFEFRAVGSSANIAFPLTLLNTIMADGIADLCKRIEGGKAVKEAVSSQIKENFRAVFNGNGYSEEWQKEAERRGLPNNRTTPQAVSAFTKDKNVDILNKYNVMTPTQVQARAEVMFHRYASTLRLEADTLLDMLGTGLLPATEKDTGAQSGTTAWHTNKKQLYNTLADATIKLQKGLDAFPDGDVHEQAEYALKSIKPLMTSARDAADAVERVLPHDLYPWPKYDDLLFGHHSQSP